MTKTEAVDRLLELADQIYELLYEMEDILQEVAPEQLQLAKSYWLAHIDGALENRYRYIGGSFISFEDTLRNLEEMM